MRKPAEGSLEDAAIAYRPALTKKGAISVPSVSTMIQVSPLSPRINTQDEVRRVAQKQDLWDLAFEALRTRDEKLVARYDRYLGREVAGRSSGQASGVQKEKELQAYISEKLDLHEKSGILGELGRQALEIVLYGKAFISEVVSTDPHASLAWTGVCLLLPVSNEFQWLEHVTDRGPSCC